MLWSACSLKQLYRSDNPGGRGLCGGQPAKERIVGPASSGETRGQALSVLTPVISAITLTPVETTCPPLQNCIFLRRANLFFFGTHGLVFQWIHFSLLFCFPHESLLSLVFLLLLSAFPHFCFLASLLFLILCLSSFLASLFSAFLPL